MGDAVVTKARPLKGCTHDWTECPIARDERLARESETRKARRATMGVEKHEEPDRLPFDDDLRNRLYVLAMKELDKDPYFGREFGKAAERKQP